MVPDYKSMILFVRQSVKLKKLNAFDGSEVIASFFPHKTLEQIMDDILGGV